MKQKYNNTDNVPEPPFTSMPVVNFNEDFQVSIWFSESEWENKPQKLTASGIPYFATHDVANGVFVYFTVNLTKVAYLLGLLNS